MDSYREHSLNSMPTKGDATATNLEVTGDQLKLLPRKRHTFNVRVSLRLNRQNGFIEDDTLVFLCKHAHEALHEVLEGQAGQAEQTSQRWMV